MGWSYRRSVSVGPLRLNLGKSGVGYSVGGAGFRTGVRSNGRAYSRVSVSGTGLSYTTTGRSATSTGFGCLILFAMISVGLVSII